MDDQTNAHSQAEEKEVVVAQDGTSKEDPRDNISPEHPRFKEVYEDLKSEKEARKAETEARQRLELELRELKETVSSLNRKDDDSFSEEEVKALSRISKGLKDQGFLTRAEAEEAQRIQDRANTIKDLQKEFNGNNGYPSFDVVEVTEYAKKNGFGDNLKAAYRDLHFNAILKVESKKGTTIDVDSEAPTGGERGSGQITRDQVAKMDPAEWAEKGPSIMEAFKKSVLGK